MHFKTICLTALTILRVVADIVQKAQFCIFLLSAAPRIGTSRRVTSLCNTMSKELENEEFDFVVLGTGLTESILAAALANSGARVLHLDANGYYGGTGATLDIAQFEQLLDVPSTPLQPESSVFRQASPIPNGGRKLDAFGLPSDVRRHVLVDLLPRILWSAGRVVQTMTATGVGHYLDFRALDGLYVQQDGLRRLPATRADVFKDRYLSMKEKRLLMRYITNAAESSDEPSLDAHMREAGLTDCLRSFILHTVVLAEDDVPVDMARSQVALFQAAAARYPTPTPLLAPDHGAGEIAQAFCRKCAVLGGIYILRCGVSDITASESGSGVVVTTDNDERIPCRALFTSTPGTQKIWHAVCIVDNGIVRDDVARALVVVPRGKAGNYAVVRILQFDSSMGLCPAGMRILHAYTVGKDGSEEDILNVLRKYVQFPDGEDTSASVDESSTLANMVHNADEGNTAEEQQPPCEAKKKPRLLWGAVYAREADNAPEVVKGDLEGVFLLPECVPEPDAEQCLNLAQKAFELVVTDKQFFEEKPPEEPEEDVGEAVQEAVGEVIGDAVANKAT